MDETGRGDLVSWDDYTDKMVGRESLFIKNSDEVRMAFRQIFDNDKKWGHSGSLLEKTHQAIYTPEVDWDESRDLVQTFINILLNYDATQREELEDKWGEGLADFLHELSLKYAEDVLQLSRRDSQGPNWWNHIKTRVSVEEDSVALRHEITVDYDRTLKVDSGVGSSVRLAEHLVRQVLIAKQRVGPDPLRAISEEELDGLADRVEELQEEVDDLEPKFPEDLDGGDAENSGDEDEDGEEGSESDSADEAEEGSEPDSADEG